MAGFLVHAGICWARGRKEAWKNTWPIAFLMISLSAVYFVMLGFLKTADALPSQGGSPFAHRYLINFVPLGIIAVTVFSHAFGESLKDKRMKICFIFLLGAILVWRMAYVYAYVHSWLGI